MGIMGPVLSGDYCVMQMVPGRTRCCFKPIPGSLPMEKMRTGKYIMSVMQVACTSSPLGENYAVHVKPKEINDFKVDLRALKLNLSRGDITKKEYAAFLKSLPDLAKQATEVSAYFEEEDVTGTDTESKSSGDLTFSVV